MMTGMLVQTLYNLVDGIWVAGLGKNALAAIGLFFPVYMIIVSIASGLSVGGSSAISRKIGAKDKKMADYAAIHTLVISLAVGLIIILLTYPFLRKIFSLLGATGQVLDYVTGYSKILVGGALIIFFTNISSGILRGEGDMQRAMYVMILGSVLNIILDPIFIYTLKMGITGAAWATLLSITISASFMFVWLFIKKSTFVTFNFKKAQYNPHIIREILKVGVPASFAQLAMAFAMFFVNMIIIHAGGTDGIAVFTSSWRIIMFGIVPLIGVAMGVTSVTGAAYGAHDIDKLKTAYYYGVRFGFVVETIIAIAIFLFARQMTFLFTYSQSARSISSEMIIALKILCLFLPGVPFGMLTSSMFQGIGKGMNAFFVTFLRTIIFQLAFSYLLAITFKLGLRGVWWGVMLGNVAASFVGFIWGQFVIAKLTHKFSQPKPAVEIAQTKL